MDVSWNNVNGDTGYKLEWKPRSGADCTAGSWNSPILIGENSAAYQQPGLTVGTYDFLEVGSGVGVIEGDIVG